MRSCCIAQWILSSHLWWNMMEDNVRKRMCILILVCIILMELQCSYIYFYLGILKLYTQKSDLWLFAIFSEIIMVLIKWGDKKKHPSYHRENNSLLGLNIYLLVRFYKIVKSYHAKWEIYTFGNFSDWIYTRK